MIESPLRASERATYEEVWTIDQYSGFAPGERYLPLFLAMSKANWGSVLDAGCGTGRAGLALAAQGFGVTLADLTADGLAPEAAGLPFAPVVLWDDLLTSLGRFDYAFCCDVLEHIPTALTMLTVARLLEITRRGLFLSVANVPDRYGVWVGRPLHQTVQPFVWWRDMLKEVGHVVEARDLLDASVFWMTRR